MVDHIDIRKMFYPVVNIVAFAGTDIDRGISIHLEALHHQTVVAPAAHNRTVAKGGQVDEISRIPLLYGTGRDDGLER